MTTVKEPQKVSANYATLRPWLLSIGARLMWHEKGPQDTGIKSMECWMIGSTLVLFQEYHDIGWEYFVQAQEGDIAKCLNALAALASKGDV